MALLDSIFSVRIVKGGVEYVQRKTLEFIGASVTVEDDPATERTKITFVPSASSAHAATHLRGAVDAVNGDRLRVTYLPGTGYSRQLATDVTTDLEELSSHFKGIDSSLQVLRRISYVVEASGAHSFALSDAYKTILCTSATAVGLQLPTNALVPYEIGTVMALIPMAAGQITLTGAGGVTLVSGGNELKSARQYGPMFVQQTSLDTWLVTGEKAA